MLVEKKEIKVEKAVLPVAGLAKRWGEITQYIPKELIPIVRRDTANIKPAIQYVIEEVIDSGVKELIFVMDFKKKALVNWINNPPQTIKNKIATKPYPVVFKMVEQDRPRGLGHAIGCARSEIGDEFFMVALPDDIVIYGVPPAKRMVDVCKKYNSSVLLSHTVPKTELPFYGVLFSTPVEKNIDEVHEMIEKPNASLIEDMQKKREHNMTTISGRYILKAPEIFKEIDNTKPGARNEIQITDAIFNLKKSGHKVYSLLDEGFRIDTGAPHRYLQATHFFYSADS